MLVVTGAILDILPVAEIPAFLDKAPSGTVVDIDFTVDLTAGLTGNAHGIIAGGRTGGTATGRIASGCRVAAMGDSKGDSMRSTLKGSCPKL